MLNGLLVLLALASILVAAWSGRMEAVSGSILTSAKQGVELAIGLVGAMTFFLGLLRVGQDGGALTMISRALAPVLRRLFPGIPPSHPAFGSMVLNLASTMLGLGNAATPFGIKAMQELNRLNPAPGTATNAMVLFLVINTAGFSILPTSILALRSAAGSSDPASVMLPIWVASACATLVGIVAAAGLSHLPRFRAPEGELHGGAETRREDASHDALRSTMEETPSQDAGATGPPREATPPLSPPRWGGLLAVICGVVFAVALALHVSRSVAGGGGLTAIREVLSHWTLPALVGGILLFGWSRGVRVFASLVEGGREGFRVALQILPYLVAILVAVGMFRASGALDWMVSLLDPITRRIGMPAEALPVALLRPLSGSGAYGLMADAIRVHGPDSFVGTLVSTLQGSTETTFYVLAVYFGAIGIKKTRHALPACLIADAAGVLTALAMVRALVGPGR